MVYLILVSEAASDCMYELRSVSPMGKMTRNVMDNLSS